MDRTKLNYLLFLLIALSIIIVVYFYNVKYTLIQSYDVKYQISMREVSKYITTTNPTESLGKNDSLKSINTISSTYGYKNDFQTKCGLIFYVHINQCAGGSLANWFKMHTSGYLLLQDCPSYLTVSNNTTLRYEWKNMRKTADSFVRSVSNGWKVLHLHHGFPGVHYIKEVIKNWKYIVEKKGCKFYQTTMIRNPLERFVSNVDKYSVSMNKVESFMESRKNWLSRYFLFGLCGYYKNNLGCGFKVSDTFTGTPNLNEEYAAEAIDTMLHFDSVGFIDRFHDYLSIIKNVTGWTDLDVKNKRNFESIHKSHKNFKITQSLKKKFLEMNQKDYLLYNTMRNRKLLSL